MDPHCSLGSKHLSGERSQCLVNHRYALHISGGLIFAHETHSYCLIIVSFPFISLSPGFFSPIYILYTPSLDPSVLPSSSFSSPLHHPPPPLSPLRSLLPICFFILFLLLFFLLILLLIPSSSSAASPSSSSYSLSSPWSSQLQLSPPPLPLQVSAEPDGSTYVFQGFIQGKDFGQFGLQRLGAFIRTTVVS